MIDRIPGRNARLLPTGAPTRLAFCVLCFVAFVHMAKPAVAGESPAITFTVSTSGAFKFVKWESAAPAGANSRICFMKDHRPLICEDVQEGQSSGTVRVAVGMPVEECVAEFTGGR